MKYLKSPIGYIEAKVLVNPEKKEYRIFKCKTAEEALNVCAYMHDHEEYDRIWKAFVRF